MDMFGEFREFYIFRAFISFHLSSGTLRFSYLFHFDYRVTTPCPCLSWFQSFFRTFRVYIFIFTLAFFSCHIDNNTLRQQQHRQPHFSRCVVCSRDDLDVLFLSKESVNFRTRGGPPEKAQLSREKKIRFFQPSPPQFSLGRGTSGIRGFQ